MMYVGDVHVYVATKFSITKDSILKLPGASMRDDMIDILINTFSAHFRSCDRPRKYIKPEMFANPFHAIEI